MNASDSSSPASVATPWFAVSMGLLGIIVGFGYSEHLHGGTSSAQVAAAPTPPSAAAPSAPSAPAAPDVAKDVPAIDVAVDHIRGNKDAKVAVIEYSDFECPFCKRVHPTYDQIMKTYGDKVMWVYRHYPLPFHQNAHKEAEASECVAELGGNDAFWKFADGIFDKTTSNGTGFPLDQLAPLAKEVGVDEAKFKDCLDSGKYAKKVDDEETGGSNAGIDGTPGNIVMNLTTKDNQLVSGAQAFPAFQTAIDAMLAK